MANPISFEQAEPLMAKIRALGSGLEEAIRRESIVVAQRDAWEETAKQSHRNCDFYRGLVVLIGEMMGDAAYMSDDGSKQQDVLCLKVPELVKAATIQRDALLAVMKESLDFWGRYTMLNEVAQAEIGEERVAMKNKMAAAISLCGEIKP